MRLFEFLKQFVRLILLTIITTLFVSCSLNEKAESIVLCPCTVIGVQKTTYRNKEAYKILVRDSNNDGYTLSFYSLTEYDLGDVIVK